MAIDPSPELERISRHLAVEKGLDQEARLELLNSYLEFLTGAAGAREASIPSLTVDEIWHLHILDTRSYARDCSRWFGSFIHHQPDSIPGEAALPHRELANCGAQDPAPCSGIGGAPAECSAPEPEPPCRAVVASVR